MSSRKSVAQRFISALQALEANRELDPLIELFDESCSIENLALARMHSVLHGKEGATRFWRNYRASFHEIQTEFREPIVTPDRVVFEWASHGRLHSGAPIAYSGASVLELKDGRVVGFRGYYDSAPFHAEAHTPSTLDRQTSDVDRPGRPSRHSQAA